MRISRSGAPPRVGRRSEQLSPGAPGGYNSCSRRAECASGDVYSWEYAGSQEHAAGVQRAVRGDIIHDKHTGLANFISIFGESPRQINVVVLAA